MIKKTAIAVYVLILTGSLAIFAWLNWGGYGLSISPFIYWWILLGWIFVVWQYKLKSIASLIFAFMLFLAAATVAVLGIRPLAEGMMRLSLLGWIVGIAQALLEFRGDEKD